MWVFSAQRKLSLFKMVPCNIVFMEDKVVLAHLTPALQKAENARAAQDIKSGNMGFARGSAAMMQFWAQYHQKYYALSADAMLAEDPSNILLDYPRISQVLFKCYADASGPEDSGATQGKLQLTLSSGETLHFVHRQRADRSVQDTLSRLFGAKLKYRR